MRENVAYIIKSAVIFFILMFSLTLVRKTINLWLNIKVKTKIVVKSTFWWLTDSIRSSIEKDVDAT